MGTLSKHRLAKDTCWSKHRKVSQDKLCLTVSSSGACVKMSTGGDDGLSFLLHLNILRTSLDTNVLIPRNISIKLSFNLLELKFCKHDGQIMSAAQHAAEPNVILTKAEVASKRTMEGPTRILISAKSTNTSNDPNVNHMPTANPPNNQKTNRASAVRNSMIAAPTQNKAKIAPGSPDLAVVIAKHTPAPAPRTIGIPYGMAIIAHL